MSKRLSNEEFLSSLTTLLTSTHASTHGSVHLTQKYLPPAATATDSTPQVLIRASNGKSKAHRTDKVLKSTKPKIGLSTVVETSDLDGFYIKYAEVCKKGMEGLRKRDKKKAKEKAKAKKKGKVAG